MTVRVRRAGVGDLSAIVALDRSASPVYADASAYTPYLRAGALLLVAEEDGEVVGFLAVRCVVDEAEIINIAVTPASRRHGIGEALLAQASRDLAASGARRLLLDVRESNVAARALYERCTFREDGRRRDYYPPLQGEGPRESAILMSRELKLEDEESA